MAIIIDRVVDDGGFAIVSIAKRCYIPAIGDLDAGCFGLTILAALFFEGWHGHHCAARAAVAAAK
jgi:hypothetical protein